MQQPFSTANTLRSLWIVSGHIRRRTVNRRHNNARLRARRLIKHPLLTKRHKTYRFKWARDHIGWNVRSRQRVHRSDENMFLLNPVDGHVRVSKRETQLSTGTYCGHNCFWKRWCYCLVMLFPNILD